MIEFFSKSLTKISIIKKDFLNKNNFHLSKIKKINAKYIRLKKRSICKNCKKKKLIYFFKSFNVDYFLCKKCNHLNGGFEESERFLNDLYSSNDGKNYSKNYIKNYNKRINDIYIPKVKFLKKILGKTEVIEIGSGDGAFLKACEIEKITALGLEPNTTMMRFAQKKLKKNKIYFSKLDQIEIPDSTNSKTCIVAIGVIEHLKDPDIFFRLFKKSKYKYLFFSVPLFSFSAILENSFKSIYPRHLGGAHTHLYTEKSLSYILKKYKLKKRAAWWFGQDMLDLSRSLKINSNINYKDIYLKNFMKKYLDKNLNDIQYIFDRKKICSEVHMIVEKTN